MSCSISSLLTAKVSVSHNPVHVRSCPEIFQQGCLGLYDAVLTITAVVVVFRLGCACDWVSERSMELFAEQLVSELQVFFPPKLGFAIAYFLPPW